jgi:hypothetical protein
LLGWFRSSAQRKQIREDRHFLEQRVRHFLESYLAADAIRKNHFYEVVAGASAACHPSIADAPLQNIERAQTTSNLALNVVRSRLLQRADFDHVQSMITDAYATVALAHRRAAAVYTMDPEMQRLGTAAVHLVTMATSYMALVEPRQQA